MAYLINFSCKKKYLINNYKKISDNYLNNNSDNILIENMLFFKYNLKKICIKFIENRYKYKGIIYNFFYKKIYNNNLLQIMNFCYDWHKNISFEYKAIEQIAIESCQKIINEVPSDIIIQKINEINYLKLRKYFAIDIYYFSSLFKYLTKKEQMLLNELKYYGINLFASDQTKVQVTLNNEIFFFNLREQEDIIVILRQFMKIKKIL